MAAVRHLGFVKFDFFNSRAVKSPILHQRTKFRKDRSNRCGDIAIFVIFQMAAAAILNFRNFNSLSAIGVNTRYHAKFHQNRSNGCRHMAIFKMAAVRHLGFVKFEIFNGRSG